MYSIKLLPNAAREFKKLTPRVQTEIKQAIDFLGNNPFPEGCRKISGLSKKIQSKLECSDMYRIRVGDYRVLYSVSDEDVVICILRIGARKEVYQFLKRGI